MRQALTSCGPSTTNHTAGGGSASPCSKTPASIELLRWSAGWQSVHAVGVGQVGAGGCEMELDALRTDLVEGVLPGTVGPVVARDALGGLVLGGVERPEAVVEVAGVQGRAQACCCDGGCVSALRQQLFQALRTLHAAYRRSVRRPFDGALMVGR